MKRSLSTKKRMERMNRIKKWSQKRKIDAQKCELLDEYIEEQNQ